MQNGEISCSVHHVGFDVYSVHNCQNDALTLPGSIVVYSLIIVLHKIEIISSTSTIISCKTCPLQPKIQKQDPTLVFYRD